MACELVRFASPKQPGFLRTASLAMAGAYFAGWVISGVAAGILLAIVGLAVGSFIWLSKRGKEVARAVKADFVKRGLNADFQVGSVFIDSKAKAIAFVDSSSGSYDLYSARDILGWEHQWEDRTSATTNAWGTAVHSRTTQANNVLVFKTNNPAKPLYKVPLFSHQAGEQWMARLGAIING